MLSLTDSSFVLVAMPGLTTSTFVLVAMLCLTASTLVLVAMLGLTASTFVLVAMLGLTTSTLYWWLCLVLQLRGTPLVSSNFVLQYKVKVTNDFIDI